jgi:hypothetical protein
VPGRHHDDSDQACSPRGHFSKKSELVFEARSFSDSRPWWELILALGWQTFKGLYRGHGVSREQRQNISINGQAYEMVAYMANGIDMGESSSLWQIPTL